MLIHPNLVSELNLPTFMLKIPELIDVAISEEKKTTSLSHYVRFKMTSTDGQWTLSTVCAFVTPNLCMPISLGLPFLEKNKIVCDHEIHSCIAKTANYNLLNSKRRKAHPLAKPHLKE